MFDYTIAVLNKVIRGIKKGIFVGYVIAQLFFIGYYTYLVVTNRHDIVLLILYCVILFFATAILILRFFLDPYERKNKEIIKRWRVVISIFSWLAKGLVISYNIYVLAVLGVTDINRLFIFISIIVLIGNILFTVSGLLLSRALKHLIFALKKDYEEIYKTNEEDIASKPIGSLIKRLNNDKDYENYIDHAFVEQRLYDSIKRHSYNSFELEGHVIKRKKLEKILFARYEEYKDVASNKPRVQKLFLESYKKYVDRGVKDGHLEILLFFSINIVEERYPSLSPLILRLVLCALSFYNEENREVLAAIYYYAIRKEVYELYEELIAQNKINTPHNLFKKADVVNDYYTEILIDDVLMTIKEDMKEEKHASASSLKGEIASIITRRIHVGSIIKDKLLGRFRKKK